MEVYLRERRGGRGQLIVVTVDRSHLCSGVRWERVPYLMVTAPPPPESLYRDCANARVSPEVEAATSLSWTIVPFTLRKLLTSYLQSTESSFTFCQDVTGAHCPGNQLSRALHSRECFPFSTPPFFF